jgi:hypothetical protein
VRSVDVSVLPDVTRPTISSSSLELSEKDNHVRVDVGDMAVLVSTVVVEARGSDGRCEATTWVSSSHRVMN